MDPIQFASDLQPFYNLNPTMQISTLLVFLVIARRGVCTQKDIEKELAMTNGAASRNVAWWTSRRADRSEGPGFVQTVPDEWDRRVNKISLTEKGEEFYKRTLNASTAKRKVAR